MTSPECYLIVVPRKKKLTNVETVTASHGVPYRCALAILPSSSPVSRPGYCRATRRPTALYSSHSAPKKTNIQSCQYGIPLLTPYLPAL